MSASTAETTTECVASQSNTDSASGVMQFVEQLGKELTTGTLHLPSFPDAVVRIRQVLSDPHATTKLVAQAVQGEPVFTAKLFRMANSVMLQRGGDPVTDLSAVINRVGFDTLKNLAVALATRQIMNTKKYSALREQLRALWEHSVETAAIAYVLARDSQCVDPDDAVLAGLIHDIGTFYIYARMNDFPELFNDIDEVAEIIPDWHTGIGHAILEDWDFPASLVEAVDEHETVDRSHVGQADLIDVIATANLLAHAQKPTEKSVDLDSVPALERLKLTAEMAIEKLNESRAEVESIKAAFT